MFLSHVVNQSVISIGVSAERLTKRKLFPRNARNLAIGEFAEGEDEGESEAEAGAGTKPKPKPRARARGKDTPNP